MQMCANWIELTTRTKHLENELNDVIELQLVYFSTSKCTKRWHFSFRSYYFFSSHSHPAGSSLCRMTSVIVRKFDSWSCVEKFSISIFFQMEINCQNGPSLILFQNMNHLRDRDDMILFRCAWACLCVFRAWTSGVNLITTTTKWRHLMTFDELRFSVNKIRRQFE